MSKSIDKKDLCDYVCRGLHYDPQYITELKFDGCATNFIGEGWLTFVFTIESGPNKGERLINSFKKFHSESLKSDRKYFEFLSSLAGHAILHKEIVAVHEYAGNQYVLYSPPGEEQQLILVSGKGVDYE